MKKSLMALMVVFSFTASCAQFPVDSFPGSASSVSSAGSASSLGDNVWFYALLGLGVLFAIGESGSSSGGSGGGSSS